MNIFSSLRVWLAGLFLCLAGVTPTLGASRAIIVVGLTTEETQRVRLQGQAELIKQGLIARGVNREDICMLGVGAGPVVRREGILEALKPGANSPDETWVVLLGTVAPSRDRVAALQISGPRLTSTDLSEALTAAPGKTFVMVGAAGGGGFLPNLQSLPNVEAVAATAASGENNEPRFPQYWADALNDKPQAAFALLAVEASKRVAAFYAENKIALAEHAGLLDRENKRILQAPFEAGLVAALSKSTSEKPRSKSGMSVADIEIPKADGDLDIERRVATPETQKLVAEAKAMAKGSAHAALILAEQVELTVARNFSSMEKRKRRIYVNTAEAIDEVARLVMASDPSNQTANLLAARVIRPDGAQILINPRSASARANAARNDDKVPGRKAPAGPMVIELPEVVAGCLVEVEWMLEQRTSSAIPEFYHEWIFASKYPLAALRLQLTIPSDEKWHFHANAFQPPTKSVEEGTTRTVTWELRDQPAFEPLVGAPPMRVSMPWLGVSSLPSWEAFAEWYGRLSRGADEMGSASTALAEEIGREHTDRMGRIKAAFERVTALRYVAIELGVGGFRPRTPEQVWLQRYGDCKDKANLLVGVLRQLGLEADFVLLNRGDATFMEFPGWQFNHAIMRVPACPAEGQAGDLWLDATDRLVPFGVIAPGDLGRQGLVFPKNAPAKFVEVVAAQEPVAEWREIWKLLPDSAGISYVGSVTLTATGAADAMLRRTFAGLTPVQRAARLHELFNIATCTIESVSAGDAYDLGQNYRLEAKVSLVSPKTLPARPPGLGRLLASPTRELPLLVSEGRATRYVQEVSWDVEAGAKIDEVRCEGAGFEFRHVRRTGGQSVEISTPAGAVAPAAYPQVHKAWLDFNAALNLPPKTP